MRNQGVGVTPNPAVARAIGLLWITLVLFVVEVVVNSASFSRYNSSEYVAFLVILTVAIWSFLIRKISAGTNWARIVYLVLFVQGTVRFIFAMPVEFGRSAVWTAVGIVGIGLQAIALYWIFTGQGNEWFQTQRASVQPPIG